MAWKKKPLLHSILQLSHGPLQQSGRLSNGILKLAALDAIYEALDWRLRRQRCSMYVRDMTPTLRMRNVLRLQAKHNHVQSASWAFLPNRHDLPQQTSCSWSPQQEHQVGLGQDCPQSCPPPLLASHAHVPAEKHDLSMLSTYPIRTIVRAAGICTVLKKALNESSGAK